MLLRPPFLPRGRRGEPIRNRLDVEALAEDVDTSAATTIAIKLPSMKPRKAAIIFILVTVTLDILAIGLITPVLPKLILNFLGGDTTGAAKWRSVRGGLCGHAISLFARTRSLVRPIWETADHPAVESRSRTRLHRDGDLADDGLALCRSNNFRNHDFKHSHRDGLHRRRYAERKTSRRVRHDRRGIRRRIHIRTSSRWIGWRRRSASPVLGRRRPLSLTNWLYGLLSSCPNRWRKISQRNSRCGARTRSARLLLRSHPELWRLTTFQFLAYLAHNVFTIWALYAIYRYAGTKE